MRLAEVVRTWKEVGATRARRRKEEALAATLRALAPAEVVPVVAWLSGMLPQGRIGLGAAALQKAAAVEPAAAATLAVGVVDETFSRVAATVGAGSQAERVRLLAALFRSATREEHDFVWQLVLGGLRQGALEGVMIEALARAAGVPKEAVQRAHMLSGDLPGVARAALAEGLPGLARFGFELFRPVLPMLAAPALGAEEAAREAAAEAGGEDRTPDDSVAAALQRLGRAAFEDKLDGARVQVHKAGRDVRVFSRRLNDVTESVPELVAAVAALPARELVLDGEAVALRPDGRPHAFQTTMRRFGRKLDVARMQAELPLRTWFFDALYVDGADLLARPTEERRAALEAAVPAERLVGRLVTGDADAARRFLADALARGHEGLLAKALDAGYEAGRRGGSWLKLKPFHTMDLVVLAAEWGHGRRRGFLSNLHLGARDPDRGGFAMLGKTFKGLSDELLAWQTRRLLELERDRDASTVSVEPALVVEVAFDGVQRSRQYPGGVALRFARVRRYRADKAPRDANTLAEVRALLPAAQPGDG